MRGKKRGPVHPERGKTGPPFYRVSTQRSFKLAALGVVADFGPLAVDNFQQAVGADNVLILGELVGTGQEHIAPQSLHVGVGDAGQGIAHGLTVGGGLPSARTDSSRSTTGGQTSSFSLLTTSDSPIL